MDGLEEIKISEIETYENRYQRIEEFIKGELSLEEENALHNYKTHLLATIKELSENVPNGLVHGDIKQEHILINKETFDIIGILDFGDVSITNIEKEFAKLAGQEAYDLSFAIQVAKHYGSINIEHLIKRKEIYEKEWEIEKVLYSKQSGHPEYYKEGLANIKALVKGH